MLIATLAIIVVAGLGFRLAGLSSEGLSEDELNKLVAVNDYRAHGLTSANGEHPFLMKAMLAISVVSAEKWNRTSTVASHPSLSASIETALRLPNAIFGALTAVLIYLLAAELFGFEVGLLAAALWSVDPMAISFGRIAKEDTLLTFFFLLAMLFWVVGQRVAESQKPKPERYYWATALALGALMASKYFPQAISIPVAYNFTFQAIPATRWRIGKINYLKFFLIMGAAFLVLNPTILLPDTWRAMYTFGSFRIIGHDSYEFMGRLYQHRGIDWFRGQPWYFYFVMTAVKLPLLTLLGFVVGLPLIFRRRVGDGRYLILFWLMVWVLTFVFSGGKFMRYMTLAMPAILMIAALGIHLLAQRCGELLRRHAFRNFTRWGLAIMIVAASFWSATFVAPHYRLYLNPIGGGQDRAGYYFPQDEFYDAYVQDTLVEIGRHSPTPVQVASEVPTVAEFYAGRISRKDLVCLDLSEPSDLAKLKVGDYLIDARGRTYFTNQAMLARLYRVSRPAFSVSLGTVPAANIYILDQKSLDALRGQ